jgi:hypothetical protein
MHTASPPAARRFDGVSPSVSCPDVPFDVITFRRLSPTGETVEITIDRAKLARSIARRARSNVGRRTASLFRAITAVILEPDAESA